MKLRRQFNAFFADWDILLCPVAASAAWTHDQKGERWERMITVNNKRVAHDRPTLLGRLFGGRVPPLDGRPGGAYALWLAGWLSGHRRERTRQMGYNLQPPGRA